MKVQRKIRESRREKNREIPCGRVISNLSWISWIRGPTMVKKGSVNRSKRKKIIIKVRAMGSRMIRPVIRCFFMIPYEVGLLRRIRHT